MSVAALGAQAAPFRRPARRPVRAVFLVDKTRLGMVAAYAALGAVLVGGLLIEASSSDDDPTEVATGNEEDVLAQPPTEDPAVLAPHVVKDGSRLERIPGISQVAANADAGGFQLRVTTSRAVQVRVMASPQSGDGASRLWTIRTSGAMTRTLDIDDLAAGSYRWVVRSPGEQPQTGSVVVRPDPEPPVVIDEPPADTGRHLVTVQRRRRRRRRRWRQRRQQPERRPDGADRPRRPDPAMMRPKAAGSALVGLAMTVAMFAGTGPSTAGDPSDTSSDRSSARDALNYSGFRIARTGKASGAWIGARRLGRHGPIIYRIDPGASAKDTKYLPG